MDVTSPFLDICSYWMVDIILLNGDPLLFNNLTVSTNMSIVNASIWPAQKASKWSLLLSDEIPNKILKVYGWKISEFVTHIATPPAIFWLLALRSYLMEMNTLVNMLVILVIPVQIVRLVGAVMKTTLPPHKPYQYLAGLHQVTIK